MTGTESLSVVFMQNNNFKITGCVDVQHEIQYLGAERVWANVTQHTWGRNDEMNSCHGDEVLQHCGATRMNKK